MANFYYVARDNNGQKLTGTEEAANPEELANRLQAKNLIVINILSEARDIKPAANPQGEIKISRQHQHSGVDTADLVLFCRQLATLLGAGVTILKCLEIISKQVSSRKLYNALKTMIKDMEGGLSLHEAMAKHPKVFSDLWVNLVESGEASGNLAIVLSRLSGYLERNAEFQKKIISALIYPAILFLAGLGALIFMTVKIIPTFANIFKGFNIQLPLLTQMLLGVSEIIRKYFLLIIVALVAGVFLFRNLIKTKEGRKQFENFLFQLPVFGDFFKALVVERFSSGMSTLVESGVPILYSLEIAEHSVGNLVMSEIIRKIKEDVRDGKPLSQQLDKSGFFEPMVVQMIAVGEEIGELPDMFKKINEFYSGYVESFLVRFTAMFEPIMLIFMGSIIALMVVGMFLPIFKIAQIG